MYTSRDTAPSSRVTVTKTLDGGKYFALKKDYKQSLLMALTDIIYCIVLRVAENKEHQLRTSLVFFLYSPINRVYFTQSQVPLS